MVAQFVYLFLAREISRELNEIKHKILSLL